MKSKFTFTLALVTAIIFSSLSSSAQTSKQEIKVENKADVFQTIKIKVSGVGCANDCKDIQKSVTGLNGVASCELIGKPAANSQFEVKFNSSIVSEKEIRTAVQ